MIPRLAKQVQKLEAKVNALPWIPVGLLKFALKLWRMPPDKRKIQSNYNLRKPNFKTCCEFGQRPIEAIKSARTANLAGKHVLKIIRTIV